MTEPVSVLPFPVTALDPASFEPVAADKVIDGNPAQAFQVNYTSASGDFCTGIYACTAGKWRVSYAEDEFCTLTAGTVRLTNATGDTQEFTAPDSFLIPAGFNGTWEAVTDVQKNFVIYEKTD